MSALARYFLYLGKEVAGYDRTSSLLTLGLELEGMEIHYEEDMTKVPSKEEKEHVLVIYTPAIPNDHKELLYFRENDFTLYKRAKVLGLLTGDTRCIAVAGTHGKTSVSTMTAHLLKQSAIDCGAFLGGISRNFNSNLVLPDSKTEFRVVEADEFDRSFLHLSPTQAVITSMDADHLDIYGTHSSILETFNQFIRKIKPAGFLVYKKGLPIESEKYPSIKCMTYALEQKADFCGMNLQISNGGYLFDLHTPEEVIKDFWLGYPGRMNVENAVAALAMALLAGANADELKKALAVYKGVERRFDVQYRDEQRVYIDDYAHHPEELNATISSVRELFPDKKITGIFQPHLFTRTRDFAEEFAKSLSMLDELFLLDIYPAREKPIEGINSQLIFKDVKLNQKVLCAKKDVLRILENHPIEVLITLGAGDIDGLVEPIKKMLEHSV